MSVASTSARYSRQELFAGVGPEGQARLRRGRVLVVGAGALGSALAEMMVRAGVAALTVVDRDYVETSNLQRQSLYDEGDVDRGLAKAAAAEAKLKRINSEVEVRGVVADLASDNAAEILRGHDLVLDGTDNFETRFLVNDVCVREGVPWVYGACVGSYGLALAVRPRVSPCLRCVLEERPEAGGGPTCDTVGVIAPIVHVVAGIQAAEAMKLLAGRHDALLPGIVAVDLWTGQFSVVDLSGSRPSCPACTLGRYDYAGAASAPTVLCGRDAVQIRPGPTGALDLEALAARLSGAGRVLRNEHLVRFEAPGAEIVVFRDGRAIVKGARDAAEARSLYARYVGN
ncbi:MAG TPA: ThiF family adenylyltransferase [Vicinamibacteria bacterium]|nr:ThiF family adenylyltransferase [Vicinamibacteria bacterium]